jgi:predicted ATPase
VILDTCEHLIEAVAALASTIFMAAPQVHILATSRETLQVEGEHVYRLDPLACPPDDAGLTAAVAQTFSAPRLFVERAVASGAYLDFSDAEAAIVVAICRKLDGVALAIELAARRVEAADLAVRHATYYRRWLEQAGTDWSTLSTGAERAPHFAGLNNIRAALEWCFGVNDNAEIGVGLAAAAAPRPMKMGTIASLWRYEAAAR